MRFAYQAFLLLYPAACRNLFGREMASVFEQAADDFRSRGLAAYQAFLFGEFAGLIAGAFSMWMDECVSRSRRRLTAPFGISVFAGALMSALSQGCVVEQVERLGWFQFARAQVPDATQVAPDREVMLLLGCGVLFFLLALSLAFVWNMRSIEARAGRTRLIRKPAQRA